MTRRKAMHVDGHTVWAWDNSHDIMLAMLVEEAEGNSQVDAQWLEQCRIAASVSPYAAEFSPRTPQERALLTELLGRVRSRLAQHGDFHSEDLAAWSVLGGEHVSGGSLRTDVLSVNDVEDVVDAIAGALDGSLAPDPSDGFWFYGLPGGRRFVEISRLPLEDLPSEPVEVRPERGLLARVRRYLRQT